MSLSIDVLQMDFKLHVHQEQGRFNLALFLTVELYDSNNCKLQVIRVTKAIL